MVLQGPQILPRDVGIPQHQTVQGNEGDPIAEACVQDPGNGVGILHERLVQHRLRQTELAGELPPIDRHELSAEPRPDQTYDQNDEQSDHAEEAGEEWMMDAKPHRGAVLLGGRQRRRETVRFPSGLSPQLDTTRAWRPIRQG